MKLEYTEHTNKSGRKNKFYRFVGWSISLFAFWVNGIGIRIMEKGRKKELITGKWDSENKRVIKNEKM